MPNSRVRVLTENANTPATPTTAMSSAIPPNAEKTNAFNRSGVSTSARTSASVVGLSTAWSAENAHFRFVDFFPPEVLRATAARMSALNAFASISSPS